jgi:EAL domain-containing protein (putative c-di-GMP-specific phosphodiesterase class I)
MIADVLSRGGAPSSAGPVNEILDAVRNHLGMEIAFAARYVEGRREFTHIRTDLPLPHRPGFSEPNEETFCWHILHGRLPELIQDVADYPLAQTLPVTPALPVGCHMDVPLRLRDGSVYGSFCCLSRTPDRSLNGRDLAALRAFADLAVVQIERELDDERAHTTVTDRVAAAVGAGQPAIALQPVFRLGDGAPVGAEALARFPDAGERPPCDWFNEATVHGVGEALELAAVRSALGALPYVPAPLYLGVNVSPAVATSPALAELLAAAPAGRVLLEVTEHDAVEDYARLRDALAPLRDHVRIAVDDVGAGYAGLRHILDLGPDVLKLDIGLTRDIDHDPARRALAAAMVRFAGDIGAGIVAEGIERDEERRVLADLGVGHGQGWLFSRALPPVAASQRLLGPVWTPPATSPACHVSRRRRPAAAARSA